MSKALARVITHREFLKMCGLAAVAAGAGQMVLAPKAAFAADQTIDGNLYVTGKVGIWATGVRTGTPDRLLHLAGNGTTSDTLPGIKIENTTYNKKLSLVVGSVGIGFRDEANLTYPLLIVGATPGSPGPNDGNVGIGTASPTAKLEVTGNVRVNGQVMVNGVTAINADGVAAQSYYA